MRELLRWTHEAVDYAWDGVIVSSVDPVRGTRQAAPGHGFGGMLRRRATGIARTALAEGALIDAQCTRREALLIRRAKDAAARAPRDVAALCAAGRFEDAENATIVLEALAIDTEHVEP